MRVAKDSKPRVFQDGRDMLLNVVIVVVLMLVAVGATGLCSYDPGRPENGPVQEVDAKTFLELESRAVNFPVRYPEMPAGWVTNSARRAMIGGQPAPVVGWVTPDEGYLQLTQTGADDDTAVAGHDSQQRPNERTEDVDGTRVRVLSSDEQDVRDLWVVDAGDARLLVTGAGTGDEFRQLISTTLATAPISAAS